MLNPISIWGDHVSLVMEPNVGRIITTLTCNHKDLRNSTVISENVLYYLEHVNYFNTILEENIENEK